MPVRLIFRCEFCKKLPGDGYFSLNPQPNEAHMLPVPFRAVVAASETLRTLSMHGMPITWLADSLCVSATKSRDDRGAR